MYYKEIKRSIGEILETRDEWELEIERWKNRGKRKNLDYYDEDEDCAGFDESLEWDEEDLKGLPSDVEEDFDWGDL